MSQIDNVIIVNEQETITVDISAYFRNKAIVARFENSELKEGKTFADSGQETYTSLQGVAEKFPETHTVYKLAQDSFTQKTNTGMNKSALEKLTVIQIKSTDASIEAGLNRVGHTDSYLWDLASTDDDDITGFAEYFADKRKLPYAQTNEGAVLTNTQVTPETGEPYDNVAKMLKDANRKIVLYYHANTQEGLHSAESAIMAFAVTGRISGVFDKPTGITVDTLSENEQVKLDENNVNYYTPYIGQAGSYMTRNLTTGGKMSNGYSIQEQVVLDRTVLNLQSAGMDALEMKIPYDDRGGTMLEGKLQAVLRQLQNEGLFKVDSIADDGTIVKGQSLKVLTTAETQRSFASLYAQQMFVAQAEVTLALNAKKVQINLAYQV